MSKNDDVAVETRTKLEFYFLALVFTVLGLSIQTGHLGKANGQYLFEISAWVSLLISGLAGLSRMEWIPIVYFQTSRKQEEEEIVKTLQGAQGPLLVQGSGRMLSLDERTRAEENLAKNVELRKQKMSKIEKGCEIKYLIHKWFFVLGLFLLICSRTLHGINTGFSSG